MTDLPLIDLRREKPYLRDLGRAFAGALLCPSGGCGECRECRTALDGTHDAEAVSAVFSVGSGHRASRSVDRSTSM